MLRIRALDPDLKGEVCRALIKGNDYRLIVSVAYQTKFVFVKFIGTHKQYDAIDADTVELS